MYRHRFIRSIAVVLTVAAFLFPIITKRDVSIPPATAMRCIGSPATANDQPPPSQKRR